MSHGKLGGHHYFLSWREPWHKFEDWDWFNGRNFCRERCMDLVSFETPLEFKMFEEVMQQGECFVMRVCTLRCLIRKLGLLFVCSEERKYRIGCVELPT